MLLHPLVAVFCLVAPAAITEETVTYSDAGLRGLRATVFAPEAPSEGLRPAIVLVHGGGWYSGNRRMMHWYGREFARNGFVAMSINYRKMPLHPFPRCLEDSKAAVRWLRMNAEAYQIDPERIAAFGKSAGGHLAALLGTTGPDAGFEGTGNPGYSSAVRAVISMYGVADLSQYSADLERGLMRPLVRNSLEEFVGAEDLGDLDAFEAASPLYHADRNAAPILFIHGDDDGLVPFEQSERFYDRLKALGVPARLIPVEGRGHGFDYVHPNVRAELFEEMLAFLREHLDLAAPDDAANQARATE